MSTDAPPTRYDEVAYPSYTHAQTHPDQLATKAMLFHTKGFADSKERVHSELSSSG